jgi:hypothetical protein
MPKSLVDQIIMLSIIGLVAWAIVGLPVFDFVVRSNGTAHSGIMPQTLGELSARENWLLKDAAGFFTFLLVLVGAAQAYLFLWQLRLIRASLVDTKMAADASRESAAAARDGVNIAKLSMIAGQRAYVHFDGMRWNSHFNPEEKRYWWNIRPAWRNGGNTPTRGLKVYVKYEFRDDELPIDYTFPTEESVTFPSATISQGSAIEGGSFTPSGSDLLDVKEGRKRLYVWGYAAYRDVFADTDDHITKFCVEAAQITGDPLLGYDKDTNIVDIRFAGYRRHNCQDEECQNNE